MNQEPLQTLCILGSTGSIGCSTLDVVRENPGRFVVACLSCENNLKLLAEQIVEFSPRAVSVGENNGQVLREMLKDHQPMPQIFEGIKGNIALVEEEGVDKVVAAIVGAAGIEPVWAAIQAKRQIALANKEAIVLAGSLVMKAAREKGVSILPVDSEHNAVFQSMGNNPVESLSHITLTASGGPFYKTPLQEFAKITPAQALRHPNWEMGSKITIDSATMMNKCLEIIEAKWLFGLEPEQIEVLVHPQSIVHSMATFMDASTIAQMGTPDMKTPIAFCLGHPKRIRSGSAEMDLKKIGSLDFFPVDPTRFPTIDLAYRVLKMGGGTAAALNGANEALVELFLAEKIGFKKIFSELVDLVDHMGRLLTQDEAPHYIKTQSKIQDAIRANDWGKEQILNNLAKNKT